MKGFDSVNQGSGGIEFFITGFVELFDFLKKICTHLILKKM